MLSRFKRLKMTDISLLSWFLGMNVVDREEGIYVTQTLYVEKILGRFNMNESTPRSVSLSKETAFKKLVFPDDNDPKRNSPYR